MKRVLLISIVSALCLVACSEKSNLGVKGRNQPAPTGEAANKTTNEVVLLQNAENKILEPNASTANKVNLGDETSVTSVLCVNTEDATTKTAQRIKILGKGQVILPQSVETENSETEESSEKMESTEEQTKDVLNVVCKSENMQTPTLTNAENVATMILTTDMEPTDITAKFDRMSNNLEKVRIACGNDELLKTAGEVLYSVESGYPVNMIIGVNTKILVETKANKEGKTYALIQCLGPTQVVKTEIKGEENTATIEEKAKLSR